MTSVLLQEYGRINTSRDLVGYSNLTLLVPHAVSQLLLEQKTAYMTAARWLRYNTIMLEMPNVKIKRCDVNPASLLPLKTDGKPHNCLNVVNKIWRPKPDLQEDSLQNPDMELFMDGSTYRDAESGKNYVGYEVVE